MASIKQILKITTLFSGVQGLNILLNLVRAKLAAVILGPSGIGLNSIYNEMRELIHTSTNLGMDVSGVREISLAYETGDSEKTKDSIALTRSWVVILALIGALICFVLAEPLSWITFSDSEHTWDFALLSPSIAFSTLACGEMAILKAVRRIKPLATISVLNVIACLITTIPIYYIYGAKGIVFAIVLSTFAIYLVAIAYSYRAYPFHICLNTSYMKNGIPMLKIGMAFVLTGFLGHGMELAIRSYLNHVSSLDTVGLYSAGFTIVMTYGGILFASLDNDFYPKLSGVSRDNAKSQELINKQIMTLLILVIPFIIVMMVMLPVLIPLLFSREFNAVIPMAQIACIGLLYRSVYLPIAYMPLASGDSRCFLGLETISYIIILAGVILGYHYFGLEGTGVALVVSNLADMIVNAAFIKYKYKINLSMKIVNTLLVATILLSVVLALCLRFLH